MSSNSAVVTNIHIKSEPEDTFENDDWKGPTEPPTEPVPVKLIKNRKGAVFFWKAVDQSSQEKTESKKSNVSSAVSRKNSLSEKGTYPTGNSRSIKDPEDDPPIKASHKRKLEACTEVLNTDKRAKATAFNTWPLQTTQLQTVTNSIKNAGLDIRNLVASGQNRVIVLNSSKPLDQDTLVKASLQAVRKCNNSQINVSGNSMEGPAGGAKKTKVYNVLKDGQQAITLTDSDSVLPKSCEVRPTFLFDKKLQKLKKPTLSKEITVTVKPPPVKQGPSIFRRKSKQTGKETDQNKALLTIPVEIFPKFIPFKVDSKSYKDCSIIEKQRKFPIKTPSTTAKYETIAAMLKQTSSVTLPKTVPAIRTSTLPDVSTSIGTEKNEKFSNTVSMNSPPTLSTVSKTLQAVSDQTTETSDKVKEPLDLPVMKNEKSKDITIAKLKEKVCNVVRKKRIEKKSSKTLSTSTYSGLNEQLKSAVNDSKIVHANSDNSGSLTATETCSLLYCSVSPTSKVPKQPENNNGEKPMQSILPCARDNVEALSNVSKQQLNTSKENPESSNSFEKSSNKTENLGTNPKSLDKEPRGDLTHVTKSTYYGVGEYLNTVSSYINKFTSNQDTMTDRSEIERTVILTTKVKKRQLMYSSIMESYWLPKKCLCSISKAVVPDEQTYFMHGGLKYLPNVGILLCGEHEMTGLKLDDDWYLCLPEIINKIPKPLSTKLQNYVRVSNAATIPIPIKFRWYMRKRQGIPVTSGNRLISLSYFQTFLGSISNLDACSEDRSGNLSNISSFHCGTVYKKLLGHKLRCISCQGLILTRENTTYFTDIDADDSVLDTPQVLEDLAEEKSSSVEGEFKQQDENDEMNNEKDNTDSSKETKTKIMMKVGMIEIAGELFHSFKLGHQTFLSLNQLYVRNVVVIKVVLTWLTEMNISPRRPPTAVEQFLHAIYSSFVNTGWIEMTALECVCRKRTMKFLNWRKDIFDAISMGQYKENFMNSLYSEDDTECDMVILNQLSGRIIKWYRGSSIVATSQMPKTRQLLRDLQIGVQHGVVKLADNSVEFLGKAHLKKDRNAHRQSKPLSESVPQVPKSRKLLSDVQKGVHCDEVKQTDNSDEFLGRDDLKRDGNALQNFKPLSDIVPIRYSKKTVNSGRKKTFKETPLENRFTKRSTGSDSTVSDHDLLSFSERKGRKRKCTQNLKYCDNDEEYNSQKEEIGRTSGNVDKSDSEESCMVVSSTHTDETTVEFIIETECVGDSTVLFGMRSTNNDSYNESQNNYTKENDNEEDKEENGSHEIPTQEQSYTAEYYSAFVKAEPYDPSWDNIDSDNITCNVSPYPLCNENQSENTDTTNQIDTLEGAEDPVIKETGLPPTHLSSVFVVLEKVKEEIDNSYKVSLNE